MTGRAMPGKHSVTGCLPALSGPRIALLRHVCHEFLGTESDVSNDCSRLKRIPFLGARTSNPTRISLATPARELATSI